jgi:hypothetical protein
LPGSAFRRNVTRGGDNDPGLAELSNQPCQKALGGFGIAACLNQNVERVTVGVDGAPEPLLFTVDWNDNLIEVPFVSCSGAIPLDAIGKVATETVHPQPNSLSADNHAAFSQQIFNISITQGEAVIRPHGIGDDLTRETKTFQARHIRRNVHDYDLRQSKYPNNLAMPLPFMRYHNPLGRHVVLRRRKTLEDAKLMDRIAVNIHPRPGAAPGVFEGNAVRTPNFYDQAYDQVRLFTRAMKTRQKGTGFLGNLMMQRICSSIASGMVSRCP